MISDLIAELPDNTINVIDVGCYTGQVTKEFVAGLPMKSIFSIGIDPIEHAKVYAFTHYVQCAVRNCEATEANFYQYSDPMCSSLLKMTENITHDPAERESKWFGGHDFERLLNTKTVPVRSLASIIEEYNLSDSTIHFLKIDAQGCDMEVFLSLGKYINNCLFVQMETITSKSKDITLYEGQSLYEDEKLIMEAHGFEFFSMKDYGALGSSYEGDVVYVNSLIKKNVYLQ